MPTTNDGSRNIPSSDVPSRDSVSAAIALVRAKQQAHAKTKVSQVYSISDFKQARQQQQHNQQYGGGATPYTNMNPPETRDPLIPVASLQRGRDPSVAAASSKSSSSFSGGDTSKSSSGTTSGSSYSNDSSKMLEYLKQTANPASGIRGVKTPQTSLPIPGAPSLESEESGIDDPDDVRTASSCADPSDQSSSDVVSVVVDEQTVSQVNAFLDKLKIGTTKVVQQAAFFGMNDHPDDVVEKLRMLSSSSSSGGVSEESSAGEIQPETLDEIAAFIDALSEKQKQRTNDTSDQDIDVIVIDETKLAPPTPESPYYRQPFSAASDVLAAAREEARKLAESQEVARRAVAVAEEASRCRNRAGGDAPSTVVVRDPYDNCNDTVVSSENNPRTLDEHLHEQSEDGGVGNREKIELQDEQRRASRPSPIYELLNPVRHSDPPSILPTSIGKKSDPPEEHEEVDMTVEEALARSESAESMEFCEEKKLDDPTDALLEDSNFDREAHLRSTVRQDGDDDDEYDQDEHYGNTNFVDTSFAASIKKNLSTVIEAATSAETDGSENMHSDDGGHDNETGFLDDTEVKEDVDFVGDEIDNLTAEGEEEKDENVPGVGNDYDGLLLEALGTQDADSPRHNAEPVPAVDDGDECIKEPVGTYRRDSVEVELASVEQTVDEYNLNKASTVDSESHSAERYATVEGDSQMDDDDDCTSAKSYAFSDTDSLPWAIRDIASEETMRATGRTRRRFVVSGPRPANSKGRVIASLLSYDSSVQPSEAVSETIDDESHFDEHETHDVNVESKRDGLIENSKSGASPSGGLFDLTNQCDEKHGIRGNETVHIECPGEEDVNGDVLLFENQSDGVEIMASFKTRENEGNATDDFIDQPMVLFADRGNASNNGSDDKLEGVVMDAVESNVQTSARIVFNPFVPHDPSGNLGCNGDSDENRPDPDALNPDEDNQSRGSEPSQTENEVHAGKRSHQNLQVETVDHQITDNGTNQQALSPGGILPFASSPIRKIRATALSMDEDDEMVAAFLQSGSVEDSVNTSSCDGNIGGSESESAEFIVSDVKYDFVQSQPNEDAKENYNEVPQSFLEQFNQLDVDIDFDDNRIHENLSSSIHIDMSNETVDNVSVPAFEMGEVPLSPTKISKFFEELDKQAFKGEEHMKRVQRFQQLVAPLLNGHKPTVIETAQIRQAAQRADVSMRVVDEFLDYVNANDPSLIGPVDSCSKDEQEELLKKWDEIDDLNEDAAIAAFLSRFGDRAEGEEDLGEEINIAPPDATSPVKPVDLLSPPRLGARPIDDTSDPIYYPKDLTEVHLLETDPSPQHDLKSSKDNSEKVRHLNKNSKESYEQDAPEAKKHHQDAVVGGKQLELARVQAHDARRSTPQKDDSSLFNSVTVDTSASFGPWHVDNDVWRRRAAMASYGWGWEEATWLSPKNGVKNPGGIDGVAAVEGLSSLMFNKHCFPFAKRNWKLSYEDRIRPHSGYFNIDVHSLQEAAAFGDGEWPQDETPWEHRQVRQRFLHEKSVAFSRNWFGSFEIVRGNDKIKAPVCKPKSMEMPMENIPDPGDWTEEWYTTWKNGRRVTSTETDGSHSYDDDESCSDTSDSLSTRTSSDDEEDEEDDVWEEAPECGTLVNVKQKIGERITRVHPDYTSSLRRSRWRKKYFPKGTFPYTS